MNSHNSRINILFMMVQMEMGGSERLIHNLVLNIDRKLFNPSIGWFFGNKALKEFSDLGVPLFHVPKIKRFDFSTMQKLGMIIRDNNIHIVNAHHFMPMAYSFYGCKIKNGIRLIYTEHSKWETEQIPWRWRRIGSFLLRHSDGVVGISSEVTKLMINVFKLPPSKAITIMNGVNLKSVVSSDENSKVRIELGIAGNDKIIGMIANLKKIKNHIFLLKAFAELRKELKSVKLLLIGQGFKDDTENSEVDIQCFINNQGLENSVLLLGYRSDIPSLLDIMDVFCLTSIKEGLPISLLEAMAAGLPVVGTKVEGIRDVIIHNKNGYLVELDDVTCLKNVLLKLCKDNELRQEMGSYSIELASQYYSLDACINQHQDLFSSVI